jgi:nucleoside-diphosphate-sugar epimerase
MRVLMVGGTGFIGTRVVDELVLRHGFAVRTTVRDYRRAVRLGRLPVEWVDGPADDPSRLAGAADGCDAVVCCAHPFSSAHESTATLDICRAVVAAAAVTTTKRLVFLSSTAIYGLSATGDIGDDTAPRPDTEYGRIKLRAEELLCREHDAGSIRLVILRPSIVYGPFSHSWTVLPARQMQNGNLVLPEKATGVCNAIYIDDVARAVGEAVRLDARSRLALNLNAGDRVSWKTFYSHYERAVRPGSLVEWPLEAIRSAHQADRRDRRGWNVVKRAIRDRAVRDRLNEIPLLARLNRMGKSFGWSGLPQAAAHRSAGEEVATSYPPHVPNDMFLDLYARAQPVDGSTAAQVLGVAARDVRAGMRPTVDWLGWAGLARPSDCPSPARQPVDAH